MKSEVAVIRLDEPFGLAERKEFRRKVDVVLSHKRFLLLDVSLLTDIDSLGLSEIFSAISKTLKKQGDTAIYGARPQVRTLFSLVQLDRVVEIYGQVDHAMQGLTKHAHGAQLSLPHKLKAGVTE